MNARRARQLRLEPLQGTSQRGSGFGAARSRDPIAGCDRGAEQKARGISRRTSRASRVDPHKWGPSSAVQRALSGSDRGDVHRPVATCSDRLRGRIPANSSGAPAPRSTGLADADTAPGTTPYSSGGSGDFVRMTAPSPPGVGQLHGVLAVLSSDQNRLGRACGGPAELPSRLPCAACLGEAAVQLDLAKHTKRALLRDCLGSRCA